ncbi:MAG: type 4a pilus biogenesis protein PilO [Planctomycetes bacterium]|nr:type 4a pilus biogenesis protein PilO [Planctomycetota bacterium]
MSSWSQKKQLVAIGAGTLLVCLGSFAGVFYTQGLIDEVQTQTESKQQEIAAADAKIKQIPASEDDVIILRENLDEYVKILPDSRELIAFVRMIDDFERQTGIQGTGLQPKNKRPDKGQQRFVPIEYNYEMKGTLWQFLKFLNLVENYERFVSITDFQITSGAGGRTEQRIGDDAVHTVKVTLQTYTYNGKAAGKEVKIANYDKRRNELREEIWKRMNDLKIEHYDYREKQGRRDILADPRISGDQLEGEKGSIEVQKQLLDRYVGQITNLQDMVQKLKNPETTLFEQYGLEKSVREVLGEIDTTIDSDVKVITYSPLKLKWSTQVTIPLDEIRAQMNATASTERAKKDPFLPKAEIEQLIAEMAGDLKAGQLEDAKGRYDSVASRLTMPSTDARYELAVKAKALQVKASTALDFRGMDLKLEGVVVNRGGRSGVLLNGEVYEEGDYIADDLLVKLVEEEQVWFVFRGLTLVRTM